ncbi:MAG: YdgA family protein [Candidatus Nitrosotenuis sp.]|nr:YdgA family protein [Candidatus Nitrosotenuis sp.]
MNKRFIAVGIVLGIIVIAAVYLGSPMFLGMDMRR